MADVEVRQEPSGGVPGFVWAIVVLAVVGLLAWFVLTRMDGTERTEIDVDVNPPAAPSTP